jgi:hypothetical protein
MTYISDDLRQQIIVRANNCSEYCLVRQEDNFFTFHVDHIVSEKHGGTTDIDNLAWSCPHCNIHKGSDVGSFDRVAGKMILTPLFNPRINQWSDHFRIAGPLIEPLTSEGRVTEFILKLNADVQVQERNGLIPLGRYPCRPASQSVQD